jgi:DNA topoisomerase II
LNNGNQDDGNPSTDSRANGDNDDEDEANDDEENEKKKTTSSLSTATNKIDTTYYDYLINMSLRNLTKERRNDIIKEQEDKHEKLEALQKKSPEDLFEDDLDHFEAEYHKVEKRDFLRR